MRSLLASPLGLLIGLSLGALGGGGSILAVPALVYAAGQSARQATATSLVLVAITSVIGVLPHWRAGRVRWGAGVVFSVAGVGGSLLGSHWNEAVDPDALLLGFSGVMFVAAWAMWRRQRRSTGSTGAAAHTEIRLDLATAVKVAVAGSAVGLLTGFFGVGGGFVIVPALVLALGFTMPEAVATSLVVITINSLVALSTRLQGGNIDWRTVVPFTVASLIGVVLGGRLAGRRDPSQLQRWFVGLLVVVAAYTAVKSGMALAG
ncbi:MAG: hypothetical protein RI900_697 [Actinomycetota bacterium]